MEEITLGANAKLNLYLDITGKREDGYHTLETVMQSVDLADFVTVKKHSEGICVSCSNPLIPENEGNICHKAAALFFEAAGLSGGAEIRVEKRIPSGAGLGGGSADAAAVLYGLNLLYDNPLSGNELLPIAAKTGADVPFCLLGGTRVCKGIGDKMSGISELHGLSERCFLVVMPDFSLSTKSAYSLYDENPTPCKNGLQSFLSPEGKFAEKLYNVFEVLYSDTRINDISKRLKDAGAEGACLTGSGSAVYGVFSGYEKALAAAKCFPQYFTCVCKPTNTGIIFIS